MTDDKRNSRVEARAALRRQLADSRARAAAIPRPRFLTYAIYVGAAQVLLMVASAVLWFGFTSDFDKVLTKSLRDSLKDVSYTVKATPPAGDGVSANSTSTASPAPKADLVTAKQTITSGGQPFSRLTLGQPVQFTVTVTNAGTSVLKDVKVERSKFNGGEWTDPKCQQTELDAGAATACTQTFTLTKGKLSDILSQLRTQTLITTALFSLMIVVLGGMIRRGSGGARWGYIALNIAGAFVGFPGAVLYITQFVSSLPKAVSVPQSLAALAGLIAIVLLVLPPSRDYFRAAREASGKQSALGGGAARARGGRGGGLFGPRPSAPAPAEPAEPAGDPVSLSKGKAKARTSEASASVAKGAELARARAKASKAKSRKTADR